MSCIHASCLTGRILVLRKTFSSAFFFPIITLLDSMTSLELWWKQMVGDQQLGNSSFASLNGRLIKSYIYHLYKALDINLATQLVYIYLPTNPGTFVDRSPILSSPVFSVGYYCYTMSLSCNRSIVSLKQGEILDPAYRLFRAWIIPSPNIAKVI